MKKLLSFFFGSVCFLAFCAGCAERADGSCDILWTAACWAVSAIAGWVFCKVENNVKVEG